MNIKKYFAKDRIILILFLLIFAVGIFVRFYRFSERISLDSDSGRDAFVAWSGAKNFQLPLTGPFISIAPITTGPWYWWQLILATVVISSKYAPWLYLGILSSILILVAYKIGSLLEGKSFGLLMAIIVALAPQQIADAHWLTNPSVVGFFSCLTVLFFLKIAKEKPSDFKAIIFGLVLGIAINCHYQSSGLLTLLFFIPFLNRKNFRTFVVSLLVFSATFIPLVLFDLNNHWFNLRHLHDYLAFEQYRVWTSNRWLTYIFDFWPKLWTTVIGGNFYSSLVFIFGTGIILGIKFFRKTLSKELLLLFISFFIQVVIIRYYRGEKFVGYIQFFHPYIFIFTALVLSYFFKFKFGKIIGPAAIIIYLFLVIPSVKADFFQGFFVDIRIVSQKMINSILKETNNNKYFLYRCKGYDPIVGKTLYGYSYLQNLIDNESIYKIGYWNGDCQYPRTFEIEIKELAKEKIDYEQYLPHFTGDMLDLSQASTAAILKAKWIPFTADEEYKDAVHWWYSEQP